MNELHLIFDSNTGLSLKDRIYKVREWAHIDNKKVSNSVDFSIRLSLLEKFSRHIIRLSAPPSPNIFSDDEEEKYEHMDMSLAMKRSNIFTTFSTILDIFLRAGRKQLKSILNDNFETWKELLQSLLYLICDCKNTLTQHAGTASLPYTCSYRPNDIHAVLKQLHILRSSRIFSTSDVDTWMTKCTLLLETNIKLPPALSSTFEEAAAAEDLRCSPLHKRDSSEKCNGDESSSILKKRKITTDCIVSTSIKDEPGGGLAVYRVCYLIEALSNGLKLPLVVTKLAQEIFHTFIILSKPSTSSLAMTTTTVTKTFASHKDSTAVKVGSSVDSNGAIDMTIRHFSATEDNASNDIISTFWQYDSECSTHLFRAERKCEQDFAAAAVAAIHLANKTILDTEDAYSSPRLHIILKELKRVLGSAHIRSLVFENPSNAFVYKADRFQDEIFTYEHLFLHRIQYDVSYWFGTITSTLQYIAEHNPETVTKTMLSNAEFVWNDRVWWFSNISARASKIELGIASLVIGNTGEKEEFRLVPQCVLSWCDVLKACPVAVKALIEEVRRLYQDISPIIHAKLKIDTRRRRVVKNNIVKK